MSDTGSEKPQPAKPSRLAGLVAPKGTAPRPIEPASQAAPEPLSPAPPARLAPATAAPASTGSKSLTLRLPDAEYERLRSHAFVARKTHQTILAEALRQYLDAAGTA